MEKPTLILFFLLFSFSMAVARNGVVANATVPFHVGVVLDMGTLVGKMGRTSISMAIDDFYAVHGNYSTRLVLHTRDSNNDVVQAASAALDLLENEQVQVIIGPQKSAQAVFVSNLGNKSQVPIISFSATSPSLSSLATPYFVRATLNDSSQVTAIASIVKAFGWREVVLIYEDTNYGRDVIPYLIDSLQGVDAHAPYRSMIPLSATDGQILEELYKLMTMQTRVFIIHMLLPMGSRLLQKAKEVGMMSEGYVWIMSDGLTNLVDSMDPSLIDSMQGALGVKLYVPKSRDLTEFNVRWTRRFQQENPNDQVAESSVFGLWAYDTVWALAMAAEQVGAGNYSSKPQNANNTLGLDSLGVSRTAPKLLKVILENKFKGISGEFNLTDGELQSSTFQIINVVGRGGRGVGFWIPAYGISRQLKSDYFATHSTLMADLNPIIWPGDTMRVPKGWDMPVSEKKLRIGVPVREGIREFVNVERDPVTNATTAVIGYCIDVFEAVLQKLPYALPHEYIPFENAEGQSAGTYNDLVSQVYLQKYDAVVGDTTIRANRSLHVDFTLPYTETGVSMIVPVKSDVNKNAWIFLKPLTTDLWMGSLAFFFFTGFVVWVMEHRINIEFRGPFPQQLGTIFYFAFSTLVFSHREKVENILSRIVVIIWVFVVLILTSSYTASLASMLTVQQLEPTVNNVNELLKNGDYVGYHKGSFVEGLLKEHFDESKLRVYASPDEYVEALSKGSRNGGVATIIDETPYIKLFLAEHCTGYTMVGPIYKAAGFGFVFPKGSPLVPDISRGILNVIEGDSMSEIENKWFGDQTACLNEGSAFTSNNLSFRSFWGLFLITGAASTCALLIFLVMFSYKNWCELKNIDHDKPIWRRLISWSKYYNKKDLNFYTFRREKLADPNKGTNANDRHAVDADVSISVDDPQDNISISNLWDANSSPADDDTSLEVASPSTEVPQPSPTPSFDSCN